MLGNLRVGTRLTLAFAGLLVLMLVVVAVGFSALNSADRQATRLASDDLVLLKAAGVMQVSQLEQAIAIREIVSNEDAARLVAEISAATQEQRTGIEPVSYTHLTLPTICSV